ncbi:MAG TPA: hypothetical protein DCM28_16345 [Phycisphaerales bacterium]|nr:hypothetical protein [Phycisphaerales bacterium]HCD31869.1 hypothetical protein [Phycisphaerales bacterium]
MWCLSHKTADDKSAATTLRVIRFPESSVKTTQEICNCYRSFARLVEVRTVKFAKKQWLDCYNRHNRNTLKKEMKVLFELQTQ